MSHASHNPPKIIITRDKEFSLLKMAYKETRASLKIDDETIGIKILDRLYRARKDLDRYLKIHPEFFKSLFPLDPKPSAPETAFLMAEAAHKADVGPSAAVAGALIDTAIGEAEANHILLENGGEIYVKVNRETSVGVYAGPSPFSNKIKLTFKCGESPTGIGTSSASVGQALTFGDADAATAIADNTALADAAATTICNAVKGSNLTSLRMGIRTAKEIKGVRGTIIIKGMYMIAWGNLPRLDYKAKDHYKREIGRDAYSSDQL